MANDLVPVGTAQSSNILSKRTKVSETPNTRVALWHLPYNEKYLNYDEDGNKWFELKNNWGENELETAERGLQMSMSRYKVETKTIGYSDNTYEVESKYPNQNKVIESHGKNHVWVRIKDKFNQLVAEKIFNNSSQDGMKSVYKNIKQGNNVFTIVKVYSYDTTKNKATDIVNFGYTSLISAFTRGCKKEQEYYMLNGKIVQAEKTENGGYKVKSNDGKILTFLVE